jgi:UPF0755 protein
MYIDYSNRKYKKYTKYLVGIFLGVFMYLGYIILYPANISDMGNFEIRNGDTINSVSENLYIENIIKSKNVFKLLLKYRLGNKQIVYGNYDLKKYSLDTSRINMLGVLDIIVNKKNYTPGISMTIPEGFTLEEVSARVNKVYSIPYNEFYEYAKEYSGYLYPETYYFSENVKKEEIIKKMLSEFKKEIGDIKREEVILASIVEGEGNGTEDMKIISGILKERIRIGMALQVDVAKETYKNNELPKNPINNPGKTAIDAVRHPTKSDYMYYITGSDGKFYYAVTFDEHKKNIRKYLK